MSVAIPVSPIAPAALNELKAWLRIATNEEDALLYGQLRAALDMAGRFTGQQLIRADATERLPVSREWLRLTAHPVSEISAVHALDAEDEPALPPQDWQADIDRDARGWVRVTTPATWVRVHYRAGIASGWHDLPEALRQGVIRYAAHGYGARENAGSAPPAAVTALWQPWRSVKL